MSLYHRIKKLLYPDEKGFPNHLPQFRLEGRSRDPDNEPGLEMRIADPLWMLGRQWQFGEFQGEDNGSPIQIKVNRRKEQTGFYSLPGDNQHRELGNMPLEAKVEATEVKPLDLRSKVRVGQQFENLIRQHFSKSQATRYINRLRREFPLDPEGPLDEKSRRFFDLMAGNVIDGGELWELIQENKFPTASFRALDDLSLQLNHWYEQLFVESTPGAWNSQQLIHQFSVHGQKDIHLHAPDYQSGHLDWYSFGKAEIGIDPAQETTDSKTFMPVRVSFSAMPDKRLFSFEDNKFDLSGMEVEQADLIRMMLIDFSLVTGSDWFTIPIEMELGELCWIKHIEVTDVFGVTTIIKTDKDTSQFLDKNPLKVWDVFKTRPFDLLQKRKQDELYQKEEHFLYLPPVASYQQESRPLEELLFLRDEHANMVWAIEKTIRNELGKPTDGYDLHLELNGPFLPPEEENSPSGIPRFVLATPVPTNWIPYLPAHIGDSDTDIELIRAMMLRNERRGIPEDIDPISQLAREDLLTIREEAIPRAGVRVQLTRQRLRWTDGKTYIWQGRKVLAGKGEGSSGLSFDQLVDSR